MRHKIMGVVVDYIAADCLNFDHPLELLPETDNHRSIYNNGQVAMTDPQE